MNEVVVARPPAWFWALAIIGLIWNAYGAWVYLGHVGAVAGAPMSEAEQSIAATMPAWATGAFAIAVFGGVLGSLGLLLRKAWASHVLVVSLLAVMIQQAWFLFLADALGVLGLGGAGLPVAIVLVAIVLVWLANKGVKSGWLT